MSTSKSGSTSRYTNDTKIGQIRAFHSKLGHIMVLYSKFGIFGFIQIKICMCIKNPDLDPDYCKIAQIMPFYSK